MTHVVKTGKTRICYIEGDCLEAAGLYIPNGGLAVVRKKTKIKVGDIVQCCKTPGAVGTMVKQVKSIDGDSITVGTAYKDASRDYTFVAGEIFGVVTEVFDKMWHDQIYYRKGRVI